MSAPIKKASKRIAVFSDTHGNKKDMEHAVRQNGPFDKLIHLGDGLSDGKSTAEAFDIPFTGVYGNEDYGSISKETCSLNIFNWTIYLMHGHQFTLNPYESKTEREKAYKKMTKMAKVNQADILLIGHTHMAMILHLNDVLILNPGDQYIGASTPPTFSLLEVDSERITATILQKEENNWQPVIGRSILK